MEALGQHTSAPPLRAGDAGAPASAELVRLIGTGRPDLLTGQTPLGAVTAAPHTRANRITAGLLLDIHGLGRDGIRQARGLTGLARQHHVSFNSLRQCIHKNGRLTAQGQDKIQREVLALATKPITGRMLLELSALGRKGIEDAGGTGEWARRHNVSVNSLRQLIHEDGSLTAVGRAKINREVLAVPTQPTNAQLLQGLANLGPDGIERARGVAALASGQDVSVQSLRQLIREDGSPTAHGQDEVNREVHALPTQPITGQLLQEVLAQGPDGIKDAGGVAALANKHGVSVRSLRQLVRENGSLTARGRDKINREVFALRTRPITSHLLQGLSALGRQGIQNAGGLAALAKQHGLSVRSLGQHIHQDGSLTVLGQDKINREVFALQNQPITGQLLQELTALAHKGIKTAGGVAAWARQHDVSFSSLRRLIREDGSLTARGQARINAGRTRRAMPSTVAP
jgi:DNA-binding phage protein